MVLPSTPPPCPNQILSMRTINSPFLRPRSPPCQDKDRFILLSMLSMNVLTCQGIRLLVKRYDTTFDYTARYRAQADFLSRTGVIPQERPPSLPAIYQESQAPHDPTTAARYSMSFLNNDHQDYPLPPSPNGVGYGYNFDNKVRFVISFRYSSIDLQPPVRVPEKGRGFSRKRVRASISIDVQS